MKDMRGFMSVVPIYTEMCPTDSNREMCPGCPGQNPNGRSALDWQPSTGIEQHLEIPAGEARIDVNATGNRSTIMANPEDIAHPNLFRKAYAHTIGRLGRWATLDTCCIGEAQLPPRAR